MSRSMQRKIHAPSSLVLLVAALFVAPAALAGTVSGTVHDGTNNRPAAGVQVILIQLQGGMEPVANTKTDSAGHYQFDYPMLGQQPMLIRVVYHGVFFHQPVPPGTATADVEVFDPTTNLSAVSVSVRAIFIQPSASSISIGEEYTIDNKTQPPLAIYRDDGTFAFSIPEGAQLHDISAQGPAGMPVIQTPIEKGHNESAIAFAFRPGETSVRVSYDVPYNGTHTVLKLNSPYSVGRVALLAQPSVQIASDGFSPAGTDQGFNVYLRDNVPAKAPLSVSISGVAPPLPSNAGSQTSEPGGSASDNSQNPSVNSRLDQSGAESPTATATTMPARLDSLKWVLVGGFAAIFALGFAFLWRRPQLAAEVPNAATSAASPPVAKVAASAPRREPLRGVKPPPAADIASAPPSAASVERSVEVSLDQLKDSLFRLELRHQAGTIADDDYARERQRIENLLRDLLRG
ncbi:MAG TPA: carboxypeptidase-like regulatory domain-containing protein [Verrucomicrobiae bacterium]|nr:carboxypeptidase-like regulatory domain-containing protein [Verrucomicrobiae bacterium]